MRYLPDDNLSYPILLETENGSGSGFFFRTDKKVFIVTALHVLFIKDKDGKNKLNSNLLKITSYDKNLNITKPIEYLIDLSKVNIRKNDLKDLVLVEFASILNESRNIIPLNGVTQLSTGLGNIVVVPEKSLKKFSEVLVSNEVFILGYPNSLGIPEKKQIECKKPLLRKGIIAGINSSNETIILDCPVYFGNSGGLVIEVEDINIGEKNFKVIGVVSQFIPFVEQLKSIQMGYINCNFENSGYSVVVPIDTIFDLTTESPDKK